MQRACSRPKVERGMGNGQEVDSLKRQVQDLQQRDQEQRQENEQLHVRQQQFMAQIQQKLQELQGQRVLTMAKDRENQQLRSTVKEKEREIQTKEKEH